MRFTAQQVADHQARVRRNVEADPKLLDGKFEFAQSESDLQDEICRYLSLKDIVFARQPMHKRSQLVEGWPDICFAHCGVPVALEAKSKDGKQTPEQELIQVRMEGNGWRYFIVRDLVRVRDILKGIENEHGK